MSKYAFTAVMETGVVVLVAVMAEDENHAEGLAGDGAKELFDGQLYDICACPVTEEFPALGVHVLADREYKEY